MWKLCEVIQENEMSQIKHAKKEREEEKFEDIQHVKRKEQPLRNMRVYM